MRKINKKIIFGFGFILLAVLLLVYIRLKANLDASTKGPLPRPSIQLSAPERTTIEKKLEFNGDILAIQQANIYSRVNGNIKKIYVNLGDFVRTGQLLAEIDKAMYIQTVKQNEGLYKQAKATYENNKINYERNQELIDKGLISQSDLDNSRTTMEVSQAQMESALANYTNAQTQLSYCDIRAPFSGYITKRLLDPGTYVSTGGQNQNTILFTLSDISQLKVMVNVLEKDLQLLNQIEDAVIKTDAYPDEEFYGTLRATSGALDLSTRTMPTEIDIENKKGLLKPGMFAKVELILKRAENILTLPSQCVLKDDKGSYVYSVSKDSVAFKKYVQLGIQDNNTYEISEGLGDSDKVVSSGQELLNEGTRVKIVK